VTDLDHGRMRRRPKIEASSGLVKAPLRGRQHIITEHVVIAPYEVRERYLSAHANIHQQRATK